ncbi:unnamed protein product, partial [Amoebophrya sp. A120]|eukprot:GSA120T00000741001.1
MKLNHLARTAAALAAGCTFRGYLTELISLNDIAILFSTGPQPCVLFAAADEIIVSGAKDHDYTGEGKINIKDVVLDDTKNNKPATQPKLDEEYLLAAGAEELKNLAGTTATTSLPKADVSTTSQEDPVDGNKDLGSGGEKRAQDKSRERRTESAAAANAGTTTAPTATGSATAAMEAGTGPPHAGQVVREDDQQMNRYNFEVALPDTGNKPGVATKDGENEKGDGAGEEPKTSSSIASLNNAQEDPDLLAEKQQEKHHAPQPVSTVQQHGVKTAPTTPGLAAGAQNKEQKAAGSQPGSLSHDSGRGSEEDLLKLKNEQVQPGAPPSESTTGPPANHHGKAEPEAAAAVQEEELKNLPGTMTATSLPPEQADIVSSQPASNGKHHGGAGGEKKNKAAGQSGEKR